MTSTKNKHIIFSYVKSSNNHYLDDFQANDAKKRAVQLLIEAILLNMEQEEGSSKEGGYVH